MQSLKSIRLAEVDNFFKQSFEQKKLIPLYIGFAWLSVFSVQFLIFFSGCGAGEIVSSSVLISSVG